MKIPVIELGDKEKTDSVSLKEKSGRTVVILKYNLQELKQLAQEEK